MHSLIMMGWLAPTNGQKRVVPLRDATQSLRHTQHRPHVLLHKSLGLGLSNALAPYALVVCVGEPGDASDMIAATKR